MGKGTWKEYFAFSKKQRNAVIILLVIAVISIVLPYLFSPQFRRPFVNQELQQQLDALQKTNQGDTGLVAENITEENEPAFADVSTSQTSRGIHPFGFDPNILNAADFQQLGLNENAVQSIILYRNKGGKFNRPDDFRKINGITKDVADILVPYIRIESGEQQTAQSTTALPVEESAVPKASIKKLDINTATADEWKELPGIGDVLSNRIVKFRNAVHGFKSVEDIRKTYGLPDSTYQLILPYLTIADTTLLEK